MTFIDISHTSYITYNIYSYVYNSHTKIKYLCPFVRIHDFCEASQFLELHTSHLKLTLVYKRCQILSDFLWTAQPQASGRWNGVQLNDRMAVISSERAGEGCTDLEFMLSLLSPQPKCQERISLTFANHPKNL